jgi:anti-sigma28 factor (negative regulator of flagellin synthesis)
MSSDKVNLNQALNQRAMAEFQKTVRNPDVAKDETSTVKELGTTTNKVSTRETFEKSSDAKTLEEMKLLIQAGRDSMNDTPDLDEQRLESIRERLLNGDYDTPQVREKVSQSLARVMKILDAFVA